MGISRVIAPASDSPDPPTEPGSAPSGVHFSPPVQRFWHWIASISLVLLILGAFLPAIMAGLVYWDDDDLLLNVLTYRTLDWVSLKWMFTTSYAGHFEPLTWLSYWADWAIWKREYSGYHVTSVLFHAATAVLVYLLTARFMTIALSGPTNEHTPANRTSLVPMVAAFCAALFAIHPLRVESVAWLAERRDVLAGFFFVGSIAAYVRGCSLRAGARIAPAWYLCALLCQVFSLLARAGAVSLPLVLVVLDFFPLRRKSDITLPRRFALLLLEKTPFLVLSVLAGLRAWSAQIEAGAMYPLYEYDAASRAAQVLYNFSFYPLKTLFPWNLGPMYQIPAREALLGWILYKGLIGTAALLLTAWICRKRLPAVSAAIAAFIVIVAPISGILQSGPQLAADRYSYLSCIGFAMLPAAAMVWLIRNRWDLLQQVKMALVLVGGVLLTMLFHATAKQSDIWTSAFELWEHGVLVSPDSSIAHTNRADSLMVLGNVEQAADHYRRALQINPRDAIAAHHFGEALANLGDLPGAEALFVHSLRLDPRRPRVFIDLAQVLVARERANEAVVLLEERIVRAPDDMVATSFLADLLATHPDEHIRNGCEASELAARASLVSGHNDPGLLLTLASAQAEDGQWDDAVATARRGLVIAQHRRLDALSRELQRRLAMFDRKIPYHHGD